MQALEPVTIADARSFLSLNIHDTEEDALLEMLIAGARAEAETYLRRHIAQQEVSIICSARPEVELADRVVYLTEITRLDDNKDLLTASVILEGTEDTGDTVIIPTDRNGRLRIRYTCEEYCPPEIKNAILMMVRNSYTDRSLDPMTDDIKRILTPHRRLRI